MSEHRAGEPPRRRAHGELETEVLGSVATAAEPVTINEVQAALGTGLAYTTVHTILTRLVEKGLVERIRSGPGHTYRPARKAAQLVAQQMQALLHRGPNRGAVLQSFVSSLSPEDEAQLRAVMGEDIR